MDLDIVIENGTIVDGTGSAPYKADVGILEGRITAVGDLRAATARTRIDAAGSVVSPGFIDMHTHSDTSLLVDPQGDSMILQGVTTLVTGNCGLSPAPLTLENRAELRGVEASLSFGSEWDWASFGDYLVRLQAARPAPNVVPLVGHCALRSAVMGFDNRAPSPTELQQMKDLLARSMAEGARGLSTGLIYSPSMFAQTDEIVELATVVGKRGGIYATHMRGEGATLLDAVRETIEIARRGQVNTEISHHKAAGKDNWGKVSQTVRLLEEANQSCDIGFDLYPYTAGSAALSQLIPPWAHDGGLHAMLARLRDPELRARIRKDMVSGAPDWPNFLRFDWQDITIACVASDRNKDVEGKTVQEAAGQRNVDPIDLVLDLILEESNRVKMINAVISEDDVRMLLRHPLATIGSDGIAVAPHGRTGAGKPHPRYYGTFPRVLARYVREAQLLTLVEAVHKMTSKAASRLGLNDRGVIRAGMAADVTVFDPQRIRDRAAFGDPHQFPEGVDYVIVNGRLVVERGKHTGARPGRVLS